MFRNKIKTSLFFPACRIFEPIRKVNEDGTTTVRLENAARVLPDCENFDLKTMLKAGVKLQQVDTKIINQNDFVLELPEDGIEEIEENEEGKGE